MYIMDVGKDLNKETGIFVVNYDGYCVNVYSFAPYAVCAAFSFMWLCLTHCGRVTQIYVFNTVNLGTSASSP